MRTGYFCPCREPHKLDESTQPSLIDSPECFFPLDTLLYCPTCKVIRCPYCVNHEPVSWFCPQCLQETTRSAAVESSNKCMRNCLRCPRCHANTTAKNAGEDKVVIECTMCDYMHTMPKPKGLLAKYIREKRRKPFDQILSAVRQRFPSSHPQRTTDQHLPSPPPEIEDAESSELPELVPLRAKFAKTCMVTGTMLAEPSRQPGQASFGVKHLARSVLPALELVSMQGTLKLVARSRSKTHAMIVKIVCLHPDITLPTELTIPPTTTLPGFPAPLGTVFRESLESRQTFMEGGQNLKSGPGWAMDEVEVPHNIVDVVAFTSTSLDNETPVGAWVRLKVPRV